MSSFCLTVSLFLGDLALDLGTAFHFLGDLLSSDLNTLLYPVVLVDVGLRFWWLYSAWFNFAVVIVFAFVLVVWEGFLLRCEDLVEVARFASVVVLLVAYFALGLTKIYDLLYKVTAMSVLNSFTIFQYRSAMQ